MSPSEDYRHLRPEDMQKFIPGVFRYEREAAIAERAVEAYRFYLRIQVEALPLQGDASDCVLLDDVLYLLNEPDE